MRTVKIFLYACTILLSSHAYGLGSDADQPIHIEADRLEIDDTLNISRYSGNVKMEQGSLNISADTIHFLFDINNDLEKLEISGSPATFNQINDKNQTLQGSALEMEYIEKKSLLELTGQARFVSENDTIESEHITVNIQTDALQAGDDMGNGRVRMLIQPKNSRNTP